MKHQIYEMLDVNEHSDVKTGEAVPYLTYLKEVYNTGKRLSTGAEKATLEQLVGLCDQDAESRNAHEFCGVHRLLGAVLFREYGRKSATVTMRKIALMGGLQGMAGICIEGDAYRELGVGSQGHDWSGTYKKTV